MVWIAGRLLYPLSDTFRKRNTAYRFVGTTPQADPAEPAPKPTPKELAQQKAIMKVYRKYQQREYERIEHPALFPSDYFFSALAELVLDDWKFVVSVI